MKIVDWKKMVLRKDGDEFKKHPFRMGLIPLWVLLLVAIGGLDHIRSLPTHDWIARKLSKD